MLGRMVLFLSFAILVLIGALTISCGSSNSSTPKPCTGGPFNVVGDWQVTANFSGGGGSTLVYGAIDAAGLALFFDSTGDTVELPTLTGACSFSGSLTAYSAPNVDPPAVAVDSVQGNVTSNTAISGSFSGASSGTLTGIPLSPLTGSVGALSGPMTGEMEGIADVLSVGVTPTTGNSMSFAGSDAFGCAIGGTFTQVGTSNVFDVSYSVTGGNGCTVSTSNGIGFESSSDYFGFDDGAAVIYLYADILASSGPFVLEMFPGCDECDRAHRPSQAVKRGPKTHPWF